MRISIFADPKASTKEGFAVVRLLEAGGAELGELDLQYSALAGLHGSSPEALDFVLLAASVYALDKLVARSDAPDAWTRDFSLSVPVSRPTWWRKVRHELSACLSFLTGDHWSVSFTSATVPLLRPESQRPRRNVARVEGQATCLFSGGLDSLAGTINLLEEQPEQRLILVGHHDAQMPGPLTDQQGILKGLKQQYGPRIAPVLARVGHTGSAKEITLRSRSLLFIALGVYAASAMGPDTSLFIPENGTIALNVPLTPARRGSCSTRTAHPYYLRMLAKILSAVGLAHPLSNPLAFKTKGEVVADCRNGELLKRLVGLSVSCAKRGHKRSWPDRSARSCGRCMPCIYRRAALHAAGLDTEQYGADICTGDVDVEDRSKEGPNDLRACLSFLKRGPSRKEIASLLLANGSLDVAQIDAYADVVSRAMDEIRSLLRDNATEELQRLAGLVP